jgi:outer membrane cobalamin receptor
MNYSKYLFLIPAVLSFNLFAQDADNSSDVEEIVVVGSQIKGAKITGALPVSIITSEDIEALGIESGEELVANIAENGGNNFNQTDFNGGYNANRGDVGALDLRNIGTGNTVTLLNGRRIVNSPGYATEWVGGSYVPVTSVNSNVIPVYGADRIEILRDGASAIYGADAVAGVVNTVLKKDFEGTTVRLRTNWYDSFAANDNKVSVQWGKDLSNGTNISIYYDHYDRGRIRATEDPKWANADLRRYLPSPSEGGLGEFNDTTWRNTSASSQWAQFYTLNVYGSSQIPNTFTLYRPDDEYCADFYDGDPATNPSSSNFYYIPGQDNMCMYDGNRIRDSSRLSYGDTMDKRGKLNRDNIMVFINKELPSGVESYTEIGMYMSETNRVLYPGTVLGTGSAARGGAGTQALVIPSTNYWLNQLVRSNGTSLFVDREDDILFAAYMRFQTPRGYDSTRKTFRFVKGWAGTNGDWDWDTAFVWSQATSEMDNFGRVDMNALDAALADDTPDAYNPFCAGMNCNEEQVLTTIFRNNKSSLYMWDVKFSNPNVFSLPAGNVGMLFGTEIRSEKMSDERDPNVNGQIPWTSYSGQTFPYVSNIANSSPSPNTRGARLITSVFMEMQIPIMENMDSQFAIRGENFNDIGSTLVGKFAVGYQPIESIKLRASTSTSFRAPNLITVNEGLIARSNTQEDPLYTYSVGENYENYSIQRVAQGNDDLESEEATNTSVGIIIMPGEQFPVLDGLTILVDKWSIETENTVGLFGERNHMLLDTLLRAQGGPTECVGNPLVVRGPYQGAPSDGDGEPLVWDANLCEAGQVIRVMDTYVNLDDRNMAGTDLSVVYSRETDVGNFGAKFTKVTYDEFEQVAGPQSAALIEAVKPGGPLAGLIAPAGFGDLIGTYGRRAYPEDKYTASLSWRNGPWSAYLTGTMIGEFFETGVTDNAKSVNVSGTANDVYACSGTNEWSGDNCGDFWLVESMLTLNFSLSYKFRNGLRLKGQIRNLEDTRAPLADETTWGAVSDVHSDYGKSYALELYKKF